MKKAEEIFDLNMPKDKADLIKYPVVKKWILNAIKYAQEEAIHETVKRCAESAKAFYGNPNFSPVVDKDSILKVETEILKELK